MPTTCPMIIATVAKNIDGRLSAVTGISPLTLSSLRTWQLEHICEAISYVRSKSRFYSDKLKDISPPKTWEEFFSLPFTTPFDIAWDPYAFLCTPRSQASRIVTLHTSGTSGKNKRIFFSDNDMERTVDFFEHGMAIFTNPGDKIAIFMPGEQAGSVGDLLSKGLLLMGAKPLIYGIPDSFEDAARFLIDNEVNGLVGLPWDIYGISSSSAAGTISGAGFLRFALLSADCVTPAMSRDISAGLGCKVYEHYGMTETCYGGGVFCGDSAGYHLREADMFFEVVYHETVTPSTQGEFGEVAITTFSSEAMPLIRYRTGDMARFSAALCPCGGVAPTLERVAGRISDVIHISGRKLLPLPQIEDAVRKVFGTGSFRILWHEHKSELTVELPPSCDSGTGSKQLFELLPLFELGISLHIVHTPSLTRDKTGMVKRRLVRVY